MCDFIKAGTLPFSRHAASCVSVHDTLENKLANHLFSTIRKQRTKTRSNGSKLLRYFRIFGLYIL